MLFEKLTQKQFIYEEVPLNKITIEEEDRIKPPAFLARNIKKLGTHPRCVTLQEW
ncbi:hypothetical protein BLFGPEAP_01105 [Candidatus Methanoperedenaceae archaeon GB50]|nr:hypothetical protein BLFGPEAP_01105 [Candidatus Methanoperedenaceae archaeon GB50]